MGKGDWRRPTMVDYQTEAERYCRTFGHRGKHICRCCGITLNHEEKNAARPERSDQEVRLDSVQ